jgi:hypothetical protein
MHPRNLTVQHRLVRHEYHDQVWFTAEACQTPQKEALEFRTEKTDRKADCREHSS